MKKSFIITGLLSAIASTSLLHAAIIDPICSFDSFTGLDQTSTNGSYKFVNTSNAPTFENGKAIFDGSNLLTIAPVNGGNIAEAFGATGTTITMTISGLDLGKNQTAPNALFTIDASGWGLGLKNDGDTSKIAGIWNNVIWNDSRNKEVDIPSGSFVLTATSLGALTSIYINGHLATEINGLGSSTAAGFSFLAIGNLIDNSQKGASFELENFYIHDQALNANQVADFVASIPEPATASLSLLGLSCLLLRRRKG